MSFRKNPAQQMSLFDTTYNLTECEKRALERSWAKVFSEDVFPYIEEERFSVLYSDKYGGGQHQETEPYGTHLYLYFQADPLPS